MVAMAWDQNGRRDVILQCSVVAVLFQLCFLFLFFFSLLQSNWTKLKKIFSFIYETFTSVTFTYRFKLILLLTRFLVLRKIELLSLSEHQFEFLLIERTYGYSDVSGNLFLCFTEWTGYGLLLMNSLVPLAFVK